MMVECSSPKAVIFPSFFPLLCPLFLFPHYIFLPPFYGSFFSFSLSFCYLCNCDVCQKNGLLLFFFLLLSHFLFLLLQYLHDNKSKSTKIGNNIIIIILKNLFETNQKYYSTNAKCIHNYLYQIVLLKLPLATSLLAIKCCNINARPLPAISI